MSYKSYQAAKDYWIPGTANIISEHEEPHACTVVYAWDGELNVVRFFPLGTGWELSHDYCKPIDDIGDP